MCKISPSILSCDFSNIKEEIDSVIDYVDYIHFDVMDGSFVDNISFGIPLISSLRKHYQIVFDTHLMIDHPLKYIDAFKKAGSDIITFHLEVQDKPKHVINKIHDVNLKAGISIKPNTNVSELKPYLKNVELVLIMSVEPGFGGQKFDDTALEKIKWLKEYREKNNLQYEIEVDGGINDITAKLCLEAGADVLVSGSYIFNSTDRKEKILSLCNK